MPRARSARADPGRSTRAAGLDSDVAPELRVVRAVHLTHATRAEQCQQMIPAERVTDHRRGRDRGRNGAEARAGESRNPSSDTGSFRSDSTSRRSERASWEK